MNEEQFAELRLVLAELTLNAFTLLRELAAPLPGAVLSLYLVDVELAEQAVIVLHKSPEWEEDAKKAKLCLADLIRKWPPNLRTSMAWSDNKPMGGDKPRRIPKEEAEIRVREWLLKHAHDPAAVTRDLIAAETKVSTGMVSKCASWKAFRDRRDAESQTKIREIPLSNTMRALIPVNCQTPDELAALIEEQEAECANDKRRRKSS